MSLRVILTVLLLATSVSVDAAITRTFDFENIAPSQGVNNRVDYASPLTIQNNGIAMTVSHENGIVFSINERVGPLFIQQFGFRALSAFNGNQGAEDPGTFLLDFDVELQSATIEIGDIGQDVDTLVL